MLKVDSGGDCGTESRKEVALSVRNMFNTPGIKCVIFKSIFQMILKLIEELDREISHIASRCCQLLILFDPWNLDKVTQHIWKNIHRRRSLDIFLVDKLFSYKFLIGKQFFLPGATRDERKVLKKLANSYFSLRRCCSSQHRSRHLMFTYKLFCVSFVYKNPSAKRTKWSEKLVFVNPAISAFCPQVITS